MSTSNKTIPKSSGISNKGFNYPVFSISLSISSAKRSTEDLNNNTNEMKFDLHNESDKLITSKVQNTKENPLFDKNQKIQTANIEVQTDPFDVDLLDTIFDDVSPQKLNSKHEKCPRIIINNKSFPKSQTNSPDFYENSPKRHVKFEGSRESDKEITVLDSASSEEIEVPLQLDDEAKTSSKIGPILSGKCEKKSNPSPKKFKKLKNSMKSYNKKKSTQKLKTKSSSSLNNLILYDNPTSSNYVRLKELTKENIDLKRHNNLPSIRKAIGDDLITGSHNQSLARINNDYQLIDQMVSNKTRRKMEEDELISNDSSSIEQTEINEKQDIELYLAPELCACCFNGFDLKANEEDDDQYLKIIKIPIEDLEFQLNDHNIKSKFIYTE